MVQNTMSTRHVSHGAACGISFDGLSWLFLDTLKNTQEPESVICVANPIMTESETNTLCRPENLTPLPRWIS